MKVLVIDAGNTRVKWALYDHGAWMRQGWVPTGDSDALAQALLDVPDPDRIVVANVAGPSVRDATERAVARYSVDVRWLRARSEQCGVTSGYARPEQLGADRWAALIGARHRYASSCLVLNAGTTLTVDALSAEGVFLGGCIVPGLALMREALARSTAQLTAAPGKFLYFPDNTADAITSGAINALAGAVDRMLDHVRRTCEPEPVVVLSGGAADALQPHLQGAVVERVDNLVLEGLLRVGLQDDPERSG